MSTLTDIVQHAQRRAAEIRPAIGGFPVLAEVLRQAGIRRNEWTLPAAQSIYLTDAGAVVQTAPALIAAVSDVPAFDRDAVIDALRADQAGQTTFVQFLDSIWSAGVTTYVVDFDQRTATYSGINGETYIEHYPAVEL